MWSDELLRVSLTDYIEVVLMTLMMLVSMGVFDIKSSKISYFFQNGKCDDLLDHHAQSLAWRAFQIISAFFVDALVF